MKSPIVVFSGQDGAPRVAASGESFHLYEWSGGGPPHLHIHHSDDEAWHVLEGTLTFRFADGLVDAPAGATVFVPAGVAHTYYELHGPSRYLIFLTPRLWSLIEEMQTSPQDQHPAILKKYDTEALPQ